jgi:hypothetical protein
MSLGATIAVIVVAVLIIGGALAAYGMSRFARRRLRERYGPEYDRAVADGGSHVKAAAELASRERRVRGLDLRALTEAERASYHEQWFQAQERFVEGPGAAVARAHQLVLSVVGDRGYPDDGDEQLLADLSVDHPGGLAGFRSARELSDHGGAASTEDLRQAMIGYRAMFDDLVGWTNGASNGGTTAAPAPQTEESAR